MNAFIPQLLDQFQDVLPVPTRALLVANVETYKQAFTVGDYEVYEQIGDVILGQFIIIHSYHTFPFLNSKEGVKIVARIRIKYTACAFLASLAEELGFAAQIMGVEENISVARHQSLLEDVFEAFLGATSCIIDKQYGIGTGYLVCHAILTAIFRRVKLDISYENLFDAKTRLKELSDFFKQRLTLAWTSSKLGDAITASLTFTADGISQTLSATARTKIDAEQSVAADAIALLQTYGLHKPPPEIFSTLKT